MGKKMALELKPRATRYDEENQTSNLVFIKETLNNASHSTDQCIKFNDYLASSRASKLNLEVKMFSAPNYTQTPNDFFDEVAKTLKEGELRVLLCIMRQTFGWRKQWDRISLSQLMEKTGMERKAVHNSLKSLIEKRLIKKYKEGKNGQENCWYSLEVAAVKKEAEIPDQERDFIDDQNISYQYPKDTPPSILKIPTKETLTKEIKSPIVPKGDLTSFSKKIKEEKKERAPRITLTDSQHEDLLKRAKGDTSLVEKWYDKLSCWKISKEIHNRSNDYAAIVKWVIDAVMESQVLGTGSKVDRVEEDRKIAQKVIEKFPHLAEISLSIHPASIEFRRGASNSVYVNFGDNGFKEQVLSNLRKMNLSLEGL